MSPPGATTTGHDPEVLVVGAGPSGLVAAITLARHGIETLVVERRTDVSALPRATHMTTRSMEIMRSWGLEQRIREGAIDIRPRGWVGHTLGDPDGAEFEIGYPSVEEAARWSPTRPAWVPQSHLEPILCSHLATLPRAELRRGTELVSLEQEDDAVAVTVRDGAGGETRTLRPRFVIGADGIRSTVRSLAGIEFRGPEDLGQRDIVLFRGSLADVIEGRPYALNGIRHPLVATFLPFGRNDRWGFGAEPMPGGPRFADMPEREIAAVIAQAAGSPGLRIEIEYVDDVTFGAQIADRYGEGRVYIAGDAAHRMTPRTGSGMNVAIHDGYDLGWKLAWVLRGWARPGLLDTYEAERRPVGAAATRRSIDPNGSEWTVAEAMRADLGGRIPHLPAGGPDARSTVDLISTQGLTAFVRAGAPVDLRMPGHGLEAPVTVRELGAHGAEALGIGDSGVLVVRPDGRPLGPQPAEATASASAAASPSRPEMSSLR